MPVTDWPENEAFNRLIEATLIFRDIHGSTALQGFLKAELSREIVIAELRARNEVLDRVDADAEQQASADLDIALKALEFYGNADNYRPRKGLPAKVASDGGKRARDAFEAISGETDDEEGE